MIASLALLGRLLLASTPAPFCHSALTADPSSRTTGVGAFSDSLERLYRSGVTWPQFLESAQSRQEMWKGNYQVGAPEPEAVTRVDAVLGRWRLLVVAEDWCFDSANTIPYLARLVEAASNLELRIVNSKAGRWVMERHKTPDGRSATPTVVLLDEGYRDLGCFVERPAKLVAWGEANKGKLSDEEYLRQKTAWYRDDRGRETVREIVELLEAAAAGTFKTCGPADPRKADRRTGGLAMVRGGV